VRIFAGMSSTAVTPRSGWLKPALWIPWQDRSGRFSWLHAITFFALLIPGIIIATRWGLGEYQPRPVNEVVHRTGLWAIRILFVSLAITPLRQMLAMPKLLVVRRMIGVTAFAYVLVHLLLYALDESFNLFKVTTEILVRYYLLIGFCALIFLGVLAATSTAKSIRRLGPPHWQTVHRLTYLAAVLAVAHHYMQSKVNVSEPVVMTGLLIWLLGYRLLARRTRGQPVGLLRLVLLGILSAVLAGLFEAAYYELFTGVSGARVLEIYVVPPWEHLRPAWVVLAITLGGTLAAFAHRRLAARR
jgi:sulfoxide reductase heme-binding subunit YedZ